MRILASVASLCVLLCGCALTPSSLPTSSDPAAVRGASIQGIVHGGQQPVVGAKVYLLAVNTTGYGGSGIPASSLNASLSLLNAANTGNTADSIGSYVLTNSGGFFAIGGDYTCTLGQQLYLYVLGGNPGAGANSAASMMAVLGNCPAAGNLATQVPYVWVNEVSTVVAAYALGGFASDSTHISSSSTTLAKTGVANAAATALNLISISTGTANTALSASGSNATVPQTKINTLANILAACINSTGPASSNCTTLFANSQNALSSGSSPTDTASAAINIAHFPGSNVSARYGLQAGVSAPFTPSLASTPNDFLLVLKHTSASFLYPYNIAFDASGNAWITDLKYNSSNLAKITPTGVISIPLASGLSNAGAEAFDLSGNLWIADNATLKKYVPGGSLTSTSVTTLDLPNLLSVDTAGTVWVGNGDDTAYGGGLTRYNGTGTLITTNSNYPWGTAQDTSGNIWVGESGSGTNGYLSKFSAAGTAIATYGAGILKEPTDLAFDQSGNLWIADYQGSIVKYSGSGTFLASYSPTSLSLGVSGSAQTLAIDGAGNIWAPAGQNTSSRLTELSAAGTTVSPASTGYLDSCFVGTYKVAVDGSGYVWFPTFVSSGSVCEIIGSGAPVVTPFVANMAAPYVQGASRP